MKFGKIEYLNLLPFHIYAKKSSFAHHIKKDIAQKGSYPSAINRAYAKRKINYAFISSIKAKREMSVDIGIISKRRVLSVIAKKGSFKKDDFESATSNVLAKVLKIDGEVYIGDKALKRYLKAADEYIDLAYTWRKKEGFDFVFARLCFNKKNKILQKIEREFGRKKIYIPYYILQQRALKTGIKATNIRDYLKFIRYKIGKKEKLSLKKFYNKASKV